MPAIARALLMLVLAALVAAPVARAQAPPTGAGPCPQGEARASCFLWTGKVTFIGDGDTLSVDLDGDGTKKPVRVRMTGINAPEETVYTNRPEDRVGECHANDATARLEELVNSANGRVQLAAIDPASMSHSRLRRAVSIRIHSGWRDLGRVMVNEGYALFLPSRHEWAWNKSYGKLAQESAARYDGIWNSVACAFGPPASIRFWVNPDPEGNDGNDANGEWFKVKNLDPANALDISGWRARDSDNRGYAFPPGTVIAPGATITLYVGIGTNTGTDFFWGLSHPILDNVRADRYLGDGAYLFDLDGDMRSAVQYPCRYRCYDFALGAVALHAAYKRSKEFVTLSNRGERALDLEGYRLASAPPAASSYVLGPDSVLAPGEQLTLHVKGDPAGDTHLDRYWGKTRTILGNAGDKVELKSPRWVEIACTAWGNQSC
ncbi:MAG: competence protein ComEC [Thermoleophilaceae bacterium]|nr:competence protein ComEC [Thermoleophilaceae bacterium]